MANELDNIKPDANTNIKPAESLPRRMLRGIDSFVDSNLGITALVLATPLAYFAGSEVLSPIVSGGLDFLSYTTSGRASELNSAYFDVMGIGKMYFTGMVSGITGIGAYALGMGPVINGCVQRNRNMGPNE